MDQQFSAMYQIEKGVIQNEDQQILKGSYE